MFYLQNVLAYVELNFEWKGLAEQQQRQNDCRGSSVK